jgi:preprotein translocase subunit Sec63
MKSLLFLTTLTAAISACVDPYSVLGISANDSDKRIIEATRDLVIFYKKDPFAHDIMLSALQEIMTARGRPIGSFVRILNCP